MRGASRSPAAVLDDHGVDLIAGRRRRVTARCHGHGVRDVLDLMGYEALKL